MFKDFDELPLLAFTLLAQMAAGMAVFYAIFPLSTFHLLTIGILLGIGGMFSFLHLGTKRNAWRTLNHLKKSWLSREILMVGVFGTAWLSLILGHYIPGAGHWFTALTGVGFVFCMAQVYRLRAVPAWNTWRINAGFLVSSLLLGQVLTGSILVYEAQAIGLNIPPIQPGWIGGSTATLLAAQWVLAFWAQSDNYKAAHKFRSAIILVGILLAGMLLITPPKLAMWLIVALSIITLIEEVIGRWLFYTARNPEL